jgi:hypothetical protein
MKKEVGYIHFKFPDVMNRLHGVRRSEKTFFYVNVLLECFDKMLFDSGEVSGESLKELTK